MSNRIRIQTSMIDARLAAAKRQGSQEAFRLQLASLGEALAANADISVAMEFMREATEDRLPKPPSPMICALTAKPMVRKRMYAK